MRGARTRRPVNKLVAEVIRGAREFSIGTVLFHRAVGQIMGVNVTDMKCLDLLFSSLDPQEGLFWQMAAAGQVENMPPAETVERYVAEPPDDTRAYLRAHALRRFGEHVASMNWTASASARTPTAPGGRRRCCRCPTRRGTAGRRAGRVRARS